MEKRYTLCPRCELNYMPLGEQYCDVCKAELGIGEANFLLPDEEDETEGKLCPICHTNYCEDGEDMCIECKKERANKEKPEEEETDEWVDDETATEIESDVDDIPLVSLDDDEEEEEEEEEEADDEEEFEYINTDDFAEDDDDDDETDDGDGF